MNKTAIISVSDKSNLCELVPYLINKNYKIISTGGTYNYLFEHFGNIITKLSDYTLYPEILDGRVKTLHPKIYGGILAKRNNLDHLKQLENLDMRNIDIVVCNLYPFEAVIKNNCLFEDAIENIDIGGVTLLRAGAKNFNDVVVLSDPSDYEIYINGNYDKYEFAIKTFEYITRYDLAIFNYLSGKSQKKSNNIIKSYNKWLPLKYGCNPQQSNAGLYLENLNNQPFILLNGKLGYINVLDAIYSWNLVLDATKLLNRPVATSFKHTSPAGAAYSDKTIDAFIKSRQADPMSSYGDFIAISEIIDKDTAKLISKEISDGIIAKDYTQDAYDILKQKKNGNYVILRGLNINKSDQEIRQLHGITLVQDENREMTDSDKINKILENIDDENIKNDMILGNIVLKYTQSNSVAFIYQGQAIGIGAGQQSRIDCVKLAKRKVEMWWLRQHPKVNGLSFKNSIRKQEKINAIIQYIENDFTYISYSNWIKNFNIVPFPITSMEKKQHINALNNVVLASDAFFPFRDNIDIASNIGTKFIIQPGGSIADEDVINACKEYNIEMVMTGNNMRLFLH